MAIEYGYEKLLKAVHSMASSPLSIQERIGTASWPSGWSVPGYRWGNVIVGLDVIVLLFVLLPDLGDDLIVVVHYNVLSMSVDSAALKVWKN